jgi:phage N-6-adenine-methyltransferase
MAGYIPSSKSIDWATPLDFFERLDAEFRFTLDAAASSHNAKCSRFFSEADDGLAQPWKAEDGSPATVWVNPPYGRQIAAWVAKARAESWSGSTVVLLVPARTDTRWFHDDVLACRRAEVRFVRGRLKFGNATAGCPFPVMLLIFRPPAL